MQIRRYGVTWQVDQTTPVCPPPCNKRRFSSKQKARKGTKSNHKRLRVYWADRCKTWHVTTEVGKE